MELTRKTPAIDIGTDYIEDKKGILPLVFLSISSLAATLVGLATLGEGIRDKSLGYWCIGLYATLVCPIQAAMGVWEITRLISNIAKRNRWLRKAIGVQVKIVDRKAEYDSYAETREETWDCRLAILLPPSIKEVQYEQVLWLRVSNRIYDKYFNRDVARILYDPADSSVWIFEGE
jgi:hypothetical protein